MPVDVRSRGVLEPDGRGVSWLCLVEMGHKYILCQLTIPSSLSSLEGFTLIDVATAVNTLLSELMQVLPQSRRGGLLVPEWECFVSILADSRKVFLLRDDHRSADCTLSECLPCTLPPLSNEVRVAV